MKPQVEPVVIGSEFDQGKYECLHTQLMRLEEAMDKLRNQEIDIRICHYLAGWLSGFELQARAIKLWMREHPARQAWFENKGVTFP